jgi:hypothetical protein
MDIENIKTQFKNSFNLGSNGFINPVLLTDSKIGFSVQKKCEVKIEKMLKIKKGNEYITLILIYIPDDALYSENQKKPLIIRASFHLFKDGKFYYDDSLIQNKQRRPIDLVSRDEYSYDIETNTFYANGKNSSADNILNEVYELHIKPSKLFKGSFLRAKMAFKKFKAFVVKLISNFFAILLYLTNGAKVTENILARYYDDDKRKIMGEKSVTNTEKSPKTIFFGIDTHLHPLISYATIHFIIFTIFFLIDFKPQYIKLIFSNNFLTVLYVIITLSFFEIRLPKFLLLIVNKTTNWHMKILFKEIKI